MAVSKQEMENFFRDHFPQAELIIEELGDKAATIRKNIEFKHLRPGGTVSGPTMMELADAALYVTILNEIALVGLAVTTNLNINFLNKPSAEKDLIAECKLIKVGKALIIGDVYLYSEGNEQPVAHAVGTYSIPPKR